ncbi:MAG: type II toxin-antitoxin system VapC family toxin [Acidobacteriota bacterium]
MYISVLTLGEIRRGIVTLTHGRKRTQLETWLQTILRPSFAGRILDVNGEIADRWGILDAEAKQNGRSVPSIDGLLAATALEHNLTLVTRNTRDFEHTLISVFNPWTS